MKELVFFNLSRGLLCDCEGSRRFVDISSDHHDHQIPAPQLCVGPGEYLHQSAAGVVWRGSDAGIAQGIIMDPLPPTISVSIM